MASLSYLPTGSAACESLHGTLTGSSSAIMQSQGEVPDSLLSDCSLRAGRVTTLSTCKSSTVGLGSLATCHWALRQRLLCML